MAAPDKGSLRTEDGTINGRYRVVRELGRGGMGRVFLVEDASAGGRRVALKAIWGHKASAEFMERFRDEFSILVKVQHENIASAFDFGQVRGTGELFFTTAFIDGQDALAATEHATADQLVDIFKQVLRGLDFLHSHGLLHNDLKPSNVLLEAAPCGAEGDGEADVARLEAKVFGSAGKVKIIDFGLLSREGVAWQKVMGTPRYLSPERIRKQPADRRSDLYSAGAFFYHVCARVPPFEAKDSRSLLRMHLEAEPVPLTRLRRDLPESVARLVGRLLRKRPEDRFDSARSALEVLCEDLGQGGAPEARSRVPEVRAGRLVGRERELGLLEERFRRVLGPEPESACVVLEGPAGVGKTRLVQELRALVQVSGGAFVSLDGASVSGHLGPVLEAIVAALETRGVGTCARLSAGAGAGAAAGGGEEMSSRIEGLVLETAKEVPVLLHVDDFHRASRIVRRFALELVSAALERGDASRRARRLMVVISRRDELRGDELHVSGVESVRLGAFAAETSRDLVREAFGQEDVPSAILETLVRVSAGNPGLLLELARELVAAERVKYSGSAWVFPASLADLPLPGSLGAVMRRRVDALDAVSRDALDWLAVCRAPASIALLARCLRKDEAPVRETLERLARLGLVAAGESPGGLRAYNVLHEVTRSIALEGQEPGRLKALHLGLAQAIEDAAGGSGGSEAWSDVLAYHWLESGNEPGFRRYAPAAVRRLQACGDLKGAIEHQRRMLDALPPDATGKRVESLARLSELHECAWDLEATQKDLEALLEAGGSLLAREDRAAVLRRMALLEIARNQCSAALGAIEEARRCLGSASDPLVRLSLDAPEAWAAWLAGQDERSRGALERAEAALEGASPKAPREKALFVGSAHHVANVRFLLGSPARAAAIHERCLRTIAGLDLAQPEAALRCSYGSVLLDMGRLREAHAELEGALGAAKRIGDRRTVCRARERMAESHLRRGDLKRALPIVEVCLEEAGAAEHEWASANGLRMLGRIHLKAGLLAEAGRALTRALDLHVSSEDRAGAAMTRVWLARLRAAEGKLAEAVALAEAARADARRHGMAHAEGLAALALAEAKLLESPPAALGLLEAAAGLFRAGGYLYDLCEARLSQARAALVLDRADAAVAALSEVAPAIEQVGAAEQRAELARLQAALAGAPVGG